MRSEWIEWNGGECPVSDGALVDVKLRGIPRSQQHKPAGPYDWRHFGDVGEIIAYRLSEPAVKEYFTVHHDMVNAPPHYQLRPGYEVYDLRQDLAEKAERLSVPHAEYNDWDRALEYLMRMWDKNMLEDAKKARWYLNKLIEKMEARDE